MPVLPRTRSRRLAVAAVVALLAGLGVGVPLAAGSGGAGGAAPTGGDGASPTRPNIVYVLADDLSWNLVQYMPHVVALQQRGMTFLNYTVTDSLCCPSRASILTGQFPHDTHVTSNALPDGGFDRFTLDGDDRSTVATSLQAAGYRTALFGKYLNRYSPLVPPAGQPQTYLHRSYVPPGWTTFDAINTGGYREYDYAMSDDGRILPYGTAPSDYATSVIQRRAQQFVADSAQAGAPFFVEASTFAPHAPYVPAPADVGSYPTSRAPRDPAYNRLPTDPPPWLAGRAPLDTTDRSVLDREFRLRVESVQAVDRLVGALEASVARAGELDDTVFVFNSDNGYHMGEYALTAGKQTAFDTDVVVPLVVAGPGVAAGVTDTHVVENIDLRPTFDQLAHAVTPANVDGRSLVPLLAREHPIWRTVAGVEHRGPDVRTPASTDPDAQVAAAGVPPSYDAIRTARFVYVRYAGGASEYYDLVADPWETHNLAGELTAAQRARLDGWLDALSTCHGARACWAAGLPRAGTGVAPPALHALCQDEPRGCPAVAAGPATTAAVAG